MGIETVRKSHSYYGYRRAILLHTSNKSENGKSGAQVYDLSTS